MKTTKSLIRSWNSLHECGLISNIQDHDDVIKLLENTDISGIITIGDYFGHSWGELKAIVFSSMFNLIEKIYNSSEVPGHERDAFIVVGNNTEEIFNTIYYFEPILGMLKKDGVVFRGMLNKIAVYRDELLSDQILIGDNFNDIQQCARLEFEVEDGN